VAKQLHKHHKRSKLQNKLAEVGLVLYVLAFAGVITALAIEPEWLDIRMLAIAYLGVQFIASLGMGYWAAKTPDNKVLGYIGTVSLAVLFTFLGLFLAVAFGGIIVISHL